jgi:hypothetical protein
MAQEIARYEYSEFESVRHGIVTLTIIAQHQNEARIGKGRLRVRSLGTETREI